MKISSVTRGAHRLTRPECMPVYDAGAVIKYEGSISKAGDNADWDWGMYQDENGEWVLMEADGPGCIYNFTQHRYPTSTVPVFRFYFDRKTTPTLTVTPADFGRTYPLVAPYADKFVGPVEQGFGPIWVVRSFVPMAFRTHCKVTSSIRLEGNNKADNQGGWGHVMFQTYDSAEGVVTFDGSFDADAVTRLYAEWAGNPVTPKIDPIQPGETHTVFVKEGAGTLHGITAAIDGYTPLDFTDLWVEITFDQATVPHVSAPLGSFFGCEYGGTPSHLNTLLLEQNTTVNPSFFRNSYPMPYYRSVSVRLVNRGQRIVYAGLAVQDDPDTIYDPAAAGYFTSSPYYPITPNIMGKNSVIADIHGAGSVVYAVLSGKDIAAGCEGDVRVFVDGMQSPTVESDGSESWASYGWGFPLPPQSNPFSAYNGRYMSNEDWSELRLTFTDSYVFRNRLVFELEHGGCNDGGGTHSGQVFYYTAPKAPEQPIGDFTPEDKLRFIGGRLSVVQDRFENGTHENYSVFTCLQGEEEADFSFTVPAGCNGLVLRRVALQKVGPQAAQLLLNGKPLQKQWLFPDSNPIYSLIEDDYLIPAGELPNDNEIEITIRPLNQNWNACRYRVAAFV